MSTVSFLACSAFVCWFAIAGVANGRASAGFPLKAPLQILFGEVADSPHQPQLAASYELPCFSWRHSFFPGYCVQAIGYAAFDALTSDR